MYHTQMPILIKDVISPLIISTIYWLCIYTKILFLNLFIFVIVSIIYVYYCKSVNSRYELMFKEETIDQKLKNMNSLSKNFITAIWVSHFAFFFFGGIALGISVPFIIYFNI